MDNCKNSCSGIAYLNDCRPYNKPVSDIDFNTGADIDFCAETAGNYGNLDDHGNLDAERDRPVYECAVGQFFTVYTIVQIAFMD